MTLLDFDRAPEENAKAIATIPSHIVISLINVIVCGFFSLTGLFSFNGYSSLIDIFFTLLLAVILGITATIYAVQTLIAKKNTDYENAVRYSHLAKIWIVIAYIFGIFWALWTFYIVISN